MRYRSGLRKLALGFAVLLFPAAVAAGVVIHARAVQRTRNAALFAAICRHDVRVVTHLLEQGANPNARDKSGRTALGLASTLGRYGDGWPEEGAAIIDQLAFHGANLRGQDGVDALKQAIDTRNASSAKILLDRGVDANSIYDGETTMLDEAVSESPSLPVIEELLSHGARVAEPVRYGYQSLLVAAAWSGRVDIATCLLDHGAAANDPMSSPLCEAAMRGDIGMVRLLVQHGADVNGKAAMGYSPAILSAAFCGVSHAGSGACVRYLLAHGANPNVRGPNGDTPLILACESNNDATAQLLLARNADANARDQSGSTPLLSAGGCSAQTIQMLLDHGARLDQRANFTRDTPLMLAAGNPAAVQLLLRRGARPDDRNAFGMTPLLDAAQDGDTKGVRFLLDAGANIDEFDEFGYNALFYAAQANSVQCLRVLFNRGARIRFGRRHGFTPLMAAAEEPNHAAPSCLALLLRHGDRINWQDGSGYTALMWAVQASRVENVAFLLAHGSRVDIHDRDGNTALDHAQDPEIKKMLLAASEKGTDR